MTIIMIVVNIILWSHLIYTFRRSRQVNKYFSALLEHVSKAADNEIASYDYTNEGLDFVWPSYYRALDRVSYLKVIHSIKPIPSFFQGTILESDDLLPTEDQWR